MKNICIAYPNKTLTFSETFIKNQLNSIPHQNELTGGRWPYLDQDKKSIFKFLMRIDVIRGSIKHFFPTWYQTLYTKALIRFLKKNKTEVLLAEYGPTGVSVYEGCKKAQVELVVHFHGYDASVKKILDEYKDSYCKMAETAKCIVAVSNDMRKQLSGLGINCPIWNIPYGIDTNRFVGSNPAQSKPVCVFVGRFTSKKAPFVTIKAFAEALKQVPDAKLIMVGNGELFEASVNLAKEMKIAGSIDFKGVKTPQEIACILKEARMFVQHSVVSSTGDSEGTPNTILEASATGLPIVSTFHAGIKEAVIHEKTGFLVNEYDEEGMARYITVLLKDPELAAKMGCSARQHILDNYELETQIKKLYNVLC